MLSDKEMHDRMVKGWRGGLGEGTRCGQGSLSVNTRVISSWLPKICAKYGIQSVCDAGAGDMCWVKDLTWDVDYKPFDLIPLDDSIQKLDITTEAMPECDAILCRLVLNHLVSMPDDARVTMAIEQFRLSAKYLIATHFAGGADRKRGFSRLDLTKWLGEPLEMSRDGHEDHCYLAIWELTDPR